MTLMAWPSPGSARHPDGYRTEVETSGGPDCAWVTEDLADGAEARSLCGCGDVVITITEESAPVYEWQEDSGEEDRGYGGSSGGGSTGGGSSTSASSTSTSAGGSSSTSASGTSASSTSAGGSSGASGTSASSGGYGGTSAGGSTSASGTSASSGSYGGTGASGTSASGGSSGGHGQGDGGRSWMARYLPWLMIVLGILLLAGLFLALKRGRRAPAVVTPGPSYEPPSDYGTAQSSPDYGTAPGRDGY
jgi:cobalamin biosynthesis Mg chelatase CobN